MRHMNFLQFKIMLKLYRAHDLLKLKSYGIAGTIYGYMFEYDALDLIGYDYNYWGIITMGVVSKKAGILHLTNRIRF